MQSMRLVRLVYTSGEPVCAPLFVSLDWTNYHPSDLEFEEAALKSAMSYGLLKSRANVVAAVEAN